MRRAFYRFIETFFRHRFLHLVPIPIMLVVFAFSYVTTKTTYNSNGTMWIERQTLLQSMSANPQDNLGYVTPAQATVDEFAELMQTDAFVRAVVKGTSLESEMTKGLVVQASLFANVRKWVWSLTLGNNVISVNATHESAEVAQQLAAATMDAYLTWRINNDKQDSQVAQTYFADLEAQYTKELDTARTALQTYLEAHPDPVRGTRPSTETLMIEKLTAAMTDAHDRLTSARTKVENSTLALTQAENNVRQKYLVIDHPAVADKSDTSKKKMLTNGLIFIVVGVFLSFLGVVGAAVMDATFRFPFDIKNVLGIPSLATIPNVSVAGKGKGTKPKRAK